MNIWGCVILVLELPDEWVKNAMDWYKASCKPEFLVGVYLAVTNLKIACRKRAEVLTDFSQATNNGERKLVKYKKTNLMAHFGQFNCNNYLVSQPFANIIFCKLPANLKGCNVTFDIYFFMFFDTFVCNYEN